MANVKRRLPDIVPVADCFDRSANGWHNALLLGDGDEIDSCENPTLVAFDPGGTTGWAVMQIHPLSLVDGAYPILNNVLLWTQGQIALSEEGESGMIHEMAWLCASWVGACILAEDFILENHSKARNLLSPVRLNAGLTYALWLQGRKLVVQGRDVKAVVTDDRLKAWGYYVRAGGLEHARDATRHALGFLRRVKGPSADACGRRHRAWPHIYGENGGILAEDKKSG